MAGRADARNLQQMRRVDSAAANDDLARRNDTMVAIVLAKRDAGTALSVEQQSRGNCFGFAPQVRPPPRPSQKSARRRTPKAPPPRHLRIPDPLLDLAVVIRGERKPRLLRGFNKAMGQRQDGAVVLDQ